MFWNWLHQDTGLQLWQVIGICLICSWNFLVIGINLGSWSQRNESNKREDARKHEDLERRTVLMTNDVD